MYECVKELGLFLFNDVVVLTEKRETHVPFSLAVNTSHTFLASVSLHSLNVSDIADTKCEYNRDVTEYRYVIQILTCMFNVFAGFEMIAFHVVKRTIMQALWWTAAWRTPFWFIKAPCPSSVIISDPWNIDSCYSVTLDRRWKSCPKVPQNIWFRSWIKLCSTNCYSLLWMEKALIFFSSSCNQPRIISCFIYFWLIFPPQTCRILSSWRAQIASGCVPQTERRIRSGGFVL